MSNLDEVSLRTLPFARLMEKSRYQRKSSLGLEFLGIIAVYMSELHPSVSGDTPDTPGAKVYEPQLKQRQEFLKCFDLHEKTESMTVQSLRILLTEDKITDVRNEMKCLDVKTYKKFEPLYEPGNLFNLLNKNIKYLKDWQKIPSVRAEHKLLYTNDIFPMALEGEEKLLVTEINDGILNGVTPQSLVDRLIVQVEQGKITAETLDVKYKAQLASLARVSSSSSQKPPHKLVFTGRHLQQGFLQKVADRIYVAAKPKPKGRGKALETQVFIARREEIAEAAATAMAASYEALMEKVKDIDKKLQENTVSKRVRTEYIADCEPTLLALDTALLSLSPHINHDVAANLFLKVETMIKALESECIIEEWCKKRVMSRSVHVRKSSQEDEDVEKKNRGGRGGRPSGNTIDHLSQSIQLRRSILNGEKNIRKLQDRQVELSNKYFNNFFRDDKAEAAGDVVDIDVDVEDEVGGGAQDKDDLRVQMVDKKDEIMCLLKDVKVLFKDLVELDEQLTEGIDKDRSALDIRMVLHSSSNTQGHSNISRDISIPLPSSVEFNLKQSMDLLGNAAPLSNKRKAEFTHLVSTKKVSKRLLESKYHISTQPNQ